MSTKPQHRQAQEDLAANLSGGQKDAAIILNGPNQALIKLIRVPTPGSVAEHDDRQIGRRTRHESAKMLKSFVKMAGQKQFLFQSGPEGSNAAEFQSQPET